MTVLTIVDHACDRFEQAWKHGERPSIESFLEAVAPEARLLLLRELLSAELELRRRAQEPIDRDEYRRRFPLHVELLDSLWGTAQLSAVWTSAPMLNTEQQKNTEQVTTQARFGELRFFKRGGLGTLYQASDADLHRDTVVKFINDACVDDIEMVNQFRLEAEITSRLDHPGVVPVYAIGQDWYGRPFYVMRLIRGRELREAIADFHHDGSLPGDTITTRQRLCNLLEHLVSACNTVAYAHDVGIVHCDIKPANIMIGKYGETFVLDWGLARTFERTPTFQAPNEPTMRPRSGSDSAQRGGTYGYISPEQLSNAEAITPSSDVYSLGATLYEILTGQPPFNGRDRDVSERIRRGDFAPPRAVNSAVPYGLEMICLKAMNVNRAWRYSTGKQMAADLQAWMRDEPLIASPDSPLEFVSRLSRRHRAATVTTLVATLVVSIASMWIALSSRHAAREAELRTRAEENFTTALDTFEDLCRPLANDEMNNLAIFRPFADRIELFANDYLRRFKDASTMRLQTARVYELRATVARMTSTDLSGPLDDLSQAENLYLREHPYEQPAAVQLRLSQIHLSQGRLLADQKNYLAALRKLSNAESLLSRLVSQQPENVEIKRSLAETYHALGEVYLAREVDLEKAKQYFVQSKDLREALRQNIGAADQLTYDRDLARSLGYLGDLNLAQGHVAIAAEQYAESLQLRANLYRNSPRDPEHRFQYARGLINFGYLERGYRGQWTDTIPKLKEAEEIQARLVQEFPEVLDFRVDYGWTLDLLAEIHLFASVSEPAKAQEHLSAARSLVKQASTLYGRMLSDDQQRHRVTDANVIDGLATSLVISASIEQATDPKEAARLGGDAVRLIRDRLGSEPLLNREELFMLSLAQAVQDKNAEAIATLDEAVAKGFNTAVRLEKHAHMGFRSLSADPHLKARFEELLRTVATRLNKP